MTEFVVDSTPTWKAKFERLGIDTSLVERFQKEKLDTVAKFSNIVGLPPGTAEADAKFVAEVKAIAGADPPIELSRGEIALLRTAWTECYSAFTAAVKSQVMQPTDGPPTKLPLPERAARSEAQRDRLYGAKLEGSFEPSRSLIDKVANMVSDSSLRYLAPCECTSRKQELQQVRTDKTFMSVDVGGHLKAVNSVQDFSADVSTEYLCRMALTRRSLALDQFDLVSFHDMEEWSDFLFELLHRDVPPHLRVTLPQLLEADRQLFVIAA
eukprot:2693944-Amphidinium_carterae.1